ncbi:glycosyltransferase [Sphingomonas qilianensis]|uniref:Glycosyltransferase n=1 Tax=Sphingomonas qilianensis TaxID=1736690 RepID=A0ABU9XNP7_9SPHN
MKILHVVPSYFPAIRYGGPIYSVHGLAAGQAALGHQVSVFTTNADGGGVSDVPVATQVDLDGVMVTYFATGVPHHFNRRLYRAPAMAHALRAQAAAFDMVHLHSVFLWPTLAAARAASSAGTPYVLSPRGMLVGNLIRAKSSLIKRAWLALFERRTIAGAAALHFTAAREAEDFAALGLRAARTIILPNGVEPPRAGPAPLSPNIAAATATPGYALYLGRLSWKKNLVALIDALGMTPALRLVIAGTDDEQLAAKLRGAIAAAGATDRVVLIDRNVEGADKEALFARCALFVLPSLNENFGNTVLEAMVRGKPVLVSSGAGVAEIVREARCGLIAAPTAAALSAALHDLVADPRAADEMGQRGAQAARDHFGWPAIAAQMVAAYETIKR